MIFDNARQLAFKILVVIVVVFGLLEVRLIWVQLAKGRAHSTNSRKLHFKREPVESSRGRIFDRRGDVLALSVPYVDVYADCDQLENPHTKKRTEKEETLKRLSELLQIDKKALREQIDRDPKAYRQLAARVTDDDVIQTLYRLKKGPFLRGIFLEKGYLRSYPQNALFGHTLGYVHYDGFGFCGVEALADAFLRGEPGYRLYQRDGKQNEIFSSESHLDRGRPGGNVQLTLDTSIQLFAELELEQIERCFEPEWAAAVVLEVGTGRILASASVPALNPANPGAGATNHWTNQVFKGGYLPGSSFKPLTMTLALEAGAVDLNERIDCERGSWRIGARRVTDVHGGYGNLTPAEILIHSSNIGIAKIALRLVPEDVHKGSEAFTPILERLRLFGFGRKPRVLSPCEEAEGKLSPLRMWDRIYTLVSVSFGYQMVVSPIQMAGALLTLANGGVYTPPRLIESYINPLGTVVPGPRSPSRRLMSRSTAANVTSMLVRAVEEGSGTPARIPGCKVAGKTGTAQNDKDRSRHTASFVAYAPADDPALLVLVVVKSPKGAMYGSKVAAPAVGAILRKSLAHLGIHSKGRIHTTEGERYVVGR